MKFVIERAALLKALGHVQSVVEKRNTIPILSNVKLEATEGGLLLTATDMDIAVVEKVPADISREGATTVSAHTLFDIARKLPEGCQVECTGDAAVGKLTIRAGSSSFTLAVLPVEEFPVFEEGDFTHHFTLGRNDLLAMLEKTRFAVSTEETRYYLNGIYLHTLELDGGAVMRAVATDGHRLARIELTQPNGAGGMPGIIVPRKTVGEVKKIVAESEQDVDVSVSDTKIRFLCNGITVISKLIDGTFPDYERVVPQANDKLLEVDARALAESVDRVSVISSDKTRAIKLSLSGGKVELSATSQENGIASETLEAAYSADPIEIGFNARYLMDVLMQIDGETVQCLLADSAAPCLVRDPADIGALYVIMPMRV